MSKDRYTDDPAWSRNGKAKKKGKMCSRASQRLLRSLIQKKRLADKMKGGSTPWCVTRTVELPSTQEIGVERSKLLYMVALGLCPKTDKPKQQFPRVELEVLDPEVEAKARAHTRDMIYKIFEERKKESIRRRALEQYTNPQVRLSRLEASSARYVAPIHQIESVECVDLVSSDDEDISSSSDDEPQIFAERVSIPFHRRIFQGHGITVNKVTQLLPRTSDLSPPPSTEKILYSSGQRQPVSRTTIFKPLQQNPDAGIFRNWKPESYCRLVPKSTENSNSSPPVIKSLSSIKLLSTLKSLPSTASSLSLGVSNDGMCKTPPKEKRVSKDKPPSSPLDSYILPEEIITIE